MGIKEGLIQRKLEKNELTQEAHEAAREVREAGGSEEEARAAAYKVMFEERNGLRPPAAHEEKSYDKIARGLKERGVTK